MLIKAWRWLQFYFFLGQMGSNKRKNDIKWARAEGWRLLIYAGVHEIDPTKIRMPPWNSCIIISSKNKSLEIQETSDKSTSNFVKRVYLFRLMEGQGSYPKQTEKNLLHFNFMYPHTRFDNHWLLLGYLACSNLSWSASTAWHNRVMCQVRRRSVRLVAECRHTASICTVQQ